MDACGGAIGSLGSHVVIIAAMACHFSTEEDVEKCIRALGSMGVQTTEPDFTFISWSAEGSDVYEQAEATFKVFGERKSSTVIAYRGVLQQFQHYQKICETINSDGRISARNKCWMLFGDADDEWHKDRVAFMKDKLIGHLAKHAKHDHEHKTAFVFNWKAVWDLEEERMYTELTDDQSSFEYWMTLVHLDLFTDFFEKSDAVYLQPPWCDLAFDTFILKQGASLEYVPHSKGDPYLYLKLGGGSYKAGASATGRENVSKFLELQLMQCFPDPLQTIGSYDGYDPLRTTQMFGLCKPVTAEDLAAIKANPNLNETTISFVQPACDNRMCKSSNPSLKLCGACKVGRYCSVGCQKAHRKKHKPNCKLFKDDKRLDIFSPVYFYAEQPGSLSPLIPVAMAQQEHNRVNA